MHFRSGLSRASNSPASCGFARARSIALAVAVALTVVSAASSSIAQDKELTEASDFRVRVQAALRLGRAGGAQSRADLERGLRDAHPAVRVACAAGLGTIGDAASIPALTQAAKSETFASVKTAMNDTIEKLRAGGGPNKTGTANSGPSSEGGASTTSLEHAKYVVQLGNMRNNSGVRTGDLDSVMKQAARNKATSIRHAVVVDGSDTNVLKRASEKRIPVLLVDGNLTRLTQSTARDGNVVVSAQVDLSIRKVPQQVLKGMVSGNASATESARNAQAALTELQNRAVGGAVESAMSSVGSEIVALSK